MRKSIVIATILLILCVRANAAMLFNTVNADIRIGNPTAVNDIRPITYSFWCKPISNFHSFPTYIAKTGYGGAGSNGDTWIQQNTNNAARPLSIGFYMVTTGADLFRESVDNTVELGVWQHYAITWDGSVTGTNIHIYKNGIEVAYAATQTSGGIIPSDATRILSIGGDNTVSDYLNGYMSDVAIWNVELSLSEIAMLSSSRKKGIPLNIRPKNLKFYMPLDDCADKTGCVGSFLDRSGFGSNGTTTTVPIGSAEEILSYQ